MGRAGFRLAPALSFGASSRGVDGAGHGGGRKGGARSSTRRR
jgi:hypothetical protein